MALWTPPPPADAFRAAQEFPGGRASLLPIFSTSVSVHGSERFLKSGFVAALPKPVALATQRAALCNALPAAPASPAPQP